MRAFSYEQLTEPLLTSEVVHLLCDLHEYRGRQSYLLEAHGTRLFALMDVARNQSAAAVSAEDARYLTCLDRVREHFDRITPTPKHICKLHSDLFDDGIFKQKDHLITGSDPFGRDRLRFVPTPASETAYAVNASSGALEHAWNDRSADPLLLIPLFVLDFLSIHPFADGNAAVAHLLQNLLLYRAGYYFGAYISLEQMTADRRESYDEALAYSSIFWQDGTNSYLPFVTWTLTMLRDACRRFEQQTGYLTRQRVSKPERIREAISHSEHAVTKRQLMALCPDISMITVERTLHALLAEGYIRKIGGGPTTAYKRL